MVPPVVPQGFLGPDDIAHLASQMRVADPSKSSGPFKTVTREQALIWLRLFNIMFPIVLSKGDLSNISTKEILRRLRLALWDSQRLDNVFPALADKYDGTVLVKGGERGEKVKLDIEGLNDWKDWQKAHVELNRPESLMKLDGFRDAARLNSYVFRHFTTSAFTQTENMMGTPEKAPLDITGAWTGTKATMSKAALDITREGGKATPFVCYHTDAESVLIMEILSVKECPWPKPTPEFRKLLGTVQETKFGHSATGPLVPMMQTPKMPLVIVRYSYMEGRPKDGSQFLLHLQNRLGETMPNASMRKVQEEFQGHLRASEKMAPGHMSLFARLLSFNAGLVDPDYVSQLQSHWNKVSKAVVEETRISFFVPCLRLRWRTMEEIETGMRPKILGTACKCCGKTEAKMICASCNSVFYCDVVCTKRHYAEHQAICKTTDRMFKNIASFPSNKLYISANTYVDFIPDTGFAVEQEMVRYSGTSNSCEPSVNEYGDERFVVRTQMDKGYSHAEGKFKGLTVMVWDRRRSLLIRTSPGDPPMAKERKFGYDIPFHAEGHARYVRLVKERGIQEQLIYLWARRVGDALELDLVDIPPQPTWD